MYPHYAGHMISYTIWAYNVVHEPTMSHDMTYDVDQSKLINQCQRGKIQHWRPDVQHWRQKILTLYQYLRLHIKTSISYVVNLPDVLELHDVCTFHSTSIFNNWKIFSDNFSDSKWKLENNFPISKCKFFGGEILEKKNIWSVISSVLEGSTKAKIGKSLYVKFNLEWEIIPATSGYRDIHYDILFDISPWHRRSTRKT